ncbi:putative helicase [Pseudomonas phage UAntarctica]|nr:putative helicase [Pseudomonas phage UAntarctica]
MPLNFKQVQAVNGALDAYEAGQPGYSILGEGGTGKTYSIMEIAKILLDGDLKMLFVAPTNKAVKQLEKAARKYGLPMDQLAFCTLHSAMGLSLLPTAERKSAVSVRDSILGDFDVLGCDEGSMMGEILTFNYFLPELQKHKLFCVMMGDRMQLPPVREQESPALTLFPYTELTQNERTKPNPDGSPNQIAEINKVLRKAIEERKPFEFKPESGQNITIVKGADFLKAVLDFFTIDTDLEDYRVLAWRNFRVDDINKAIRRKIYGPDAMRFEVGERLVTGAPIKKGDEIALSTDEECIVKAIRESLVTDEATGDKWKTWLLTLEPIYAKCGQVFAHVLHEDETLRYKETRSRMADKAEEAKKNGNNAGWHWKRFHDFGDLFSDIRYCYCITVHRSQGSTFKGGFVDAKDILDNPQPRERKQMFYVANSRFQFHVTLNKSGFKI